jgi:hypothetical protein
MSIMSLVGKVTSEYLTLSREGAERGKELRNCYGVLLPKVCGYQRGPLWVDYLSPERARAKGSAAAGATLH